MIKYNHDELANNLAVHLMNESRMVWEDIPVGKSGSIRPDVFTIEKSFSKPNPISYEIKVSVSDFRSDITSGKWKGYLDFSHGVVFAVPKGLITKKDIPTGCGLITFNGEFWNTVKRPTIHHSVLNDEFLMKLLIGGNERQTQKPIIQSRDFDEWKQRETLRKKFGEDFASKIALLDGYQEKKEELEMMKNRLFSALGITPERWNGEWQIMKKIERIEEMTDDKKMRAKIAKELSRTKSILDRQLESIIKDFSGE